MCHAFLADINDLKEDFREAREDSYWDDSLSVCILKTCFLTGRILIFIIRLPLILLYYFFLCFLCDKRTRNGNPLFYK